MYAFYLGAGARLVAVSLSVDGVIKVRQTRAPALVPILGRKKVGAQHDAAVAAHLFLISDISRCGVSVWYMLLRTDPSKFSGKGGGEGRVR